MLLLLLVRVYWCCYCSYKFVAINRFLFYRLLYGNPVAACASLLLLSSMLLLLLLLLLLLYTVPWYHYNSVTLDQSCTMPRYRFDSPIMFGNPRCTLTSGAVRSNTCGVAFVVAAAAATTTSTNMVPCRALSI